MNNKTNISDVNSQDEGIDVKKIIYLLLRQWHWLTLLAAIGLIGAFSYTKLTKPSYMVSTSVLVPEKSNGLDMRELFQGAAGTTNNNIFNQIEIIKSYYNVNQTLINLNWRTN